MIELISLIIITYNRSDDLMDLLESLRLQNDTSSLKEVLILNNASTISYETVENFISQNRDLKINYILSAENLGVSRGRNKLMSMATGELLLVLDDDIIFSNSAILQKITTIFETPFFKDANTGIITFRVIYYDTKKLQRTALPHKQFEKYKDEPVFLTSYFAGCAHMLKKKILTATGLYPEDFFYGMEEYDLSYRVINAGYSIGYSNAATFEHKESQGGRQAHYQKLSAQWVNKSKVAWRYLPRIYYLTTMFCWSFEYTRRANGNWITYFISWTKAFRICFNERRKPIGKKALVYLKQVKARLWY